MPDVMRLRPVGLHAITSSAISGPNLRRRIFNTQSRTITPMRTERDYCCLLNSLSKDEDYTRRHTPKPEACGCITCCKNPTCKSLIIILRSFHPQSYLSYHLCHNHRNPQNEAHRQYRTWQRLGCHSLHRQRRCCQGQAGRLWFKGHWWRVRTNSHTKHQR